MTFGHSIPSSSEEGSFWHCPNVWTYVVIFRDNHFAWSEDLNDRLLRIEKSDAAPEDLTKQKTFNPLGNMLKNTSNFPDKEETT